MKNPLWQITDNQASLATGEFTAQVDLARPDLGLTKLRIAGEDWTGNVLGVAIDSGIETEASGQAATIAQVPVEAYARGRDLVATYESTPQCPVRFQVYWRVVNDNSVRDLAIVEAIVSVQTPLLETYPEVAVSSSLTTQKYEYFASDGEALLSLEKASSSWQAETTDTQGIALATLAGQRSYAEMVHPEDFLSWQISPGVETPECWTTWRVCDQFMEKGVIRRLRTRGLFYHRAAKPAELLEQLAQLASEQPPLTV